MTSEVLAQKANAERAALRLCFAINLVAYVFGLMVFTGISLSDGDGRYELLAPTIWWTVALGGLSLTVAIVELIARVSLRSL